MSTTQFRARFWTRSEIKETLKECVHVGFEVTKDNNIWSATDPSNGETVLRALIIDGQKAHPCRVNPNYFNL